MREIKFRAWNGKRMKFDIAPINSESYIVFETKRKNAQDLHINRGKIMQYTGLKDGNGIEIYEGDICQLGNTLSIVEYRVSQFVLREITQELHPNVLEFEVYKQSVSESIIGNIYENPELIK